MRHITTCLANIGVDGVDDSHCNCGAAIQLPPIEDELARKIADSLFESSQAICKNRVVWEEYYRQAKLLIPIVKVTHA